MALGRLNRPGLMVYGGTIRAGQCGSSGKLDIVSAFQAYGKYLQDGETEEAELERVCPHSLQYLRREDRRHAKCTNVVWWAYNRVM